ncbi:MAG: SPOR domain-containing protein [Treponema sp.]|nr:SPOR domain-containing protein [Treponema sp.]
MKKTLILAAAAVLLITAGASAWEGAAAVSSGTSLPETGFYAATNTFTANTVVDITNLENNSTVRAIVMSGLDNPGILVEISPEAARAIGLNPRTVGRVTMNQSVDPRSSLLPAGSGDPDHDPAALIASVGLNPQIFTDEVLVNMYNNGQTDQELPVPGFLPAAVPMAAAAPAGTAAPLTAAAPAMPAAEAQVSAGSEIKSAFTALRAQTDQSEPETASSEIKAAFNNIKADPGTPDTIDTVQLPVTQSPEIQLPPSAGSDIRAAFAASRNNAAAVPDTAAPSDIIAPSVAAAAPMQPAAAAQPYTANPEAYDYSLQPAGNKVPVETIPLIDPAKIVDTWVPPVLAPSQVTPPQVTPSQITAAQVLAAAPQVQAQQAPAVSGQNYSLQEIAPYIIESIPENTMPAALPAAAEITAANSLPTALQSPSAIQSPAQNPAQVNPDYKFSAPVIKSLEKNRYYVQLGAYNRPETVQAELDKIGKTWPLTVQDSGTMDKPLYRILVGPVNLGESGALLQRFRSTYKDAFVRLGS